MRTFKEGSHGAEFVPELHVVSDSIFTKTKSNALTSEAFAAFLREHGITELYLAGADATASSNLRHSIWQRRDIPSMCSETVSPATTKRNCRRCWTITPKSAATLRRLHHKEGKPMAFLSVLEKYNNLALPQGAFRRRHASALQCVVR